jgi:hypothetical protein
VLETVIEFALRLGKADALKDLLDLAAFALVTPEIAGESRIQKVSEFSRHWVARITAVRHRYRFVESTLWNSALWVMCFIIIFAGIVISYRRKMGLPLQGERAWWSDTIIIVLGFICMTWASMLLLDLLLFLARRAVTRRVFFGIGVVSFVVARVLGIWGAIKLP